MDTAIKKRHAESAAHEQLKRLALLWAQGQGFSACAFEVTLPRCRYRADLVAYRCRPAGTEATAILECKQARCDLRRDNCATLTTRQRLETVCRRRNTLEKHLRVHYPRLRICDSLFPEFDSHDFAAIGHRGYHRVLREMSALQNQLSDCTKFENLLRYRCANLFFLVVTEELFDDTEIPANWGALVESGESLRLARKPVWQETASDQNIRILNRIAAAGTRQLNRQLGITFENVISARTAAV